MNCSAHSLTKSRSLDHWRPDGLGKGLGQLGGLASNDGAMLGNGVDVLDDLIEFRNLAIGYDDGAFKLFEDRHSGLVDITNSFAYLVEDAAKSEQWNRA